MDIQRPNSPSPLARAQTRTPFALGSTSVRANPKMPKPAQPSLKALRGATPSPKHHWWRRIFLRIGLVLACLTVGWFLAGGYFVASTLHFENRPLPLLAGLTSFGKSLFGSAPLAGETDGRVNFLLLGRAGSHYPGKNLTDTIMIASLDARHGRVALLSLPRDLLVPITGGASAIKLNALYQYGLSQGNDIQSLRQGVEYITGLPIHYFAMVDFDGFEKVIDALGGITLEVPHALHDTRYPGKNYSYETFSIEAGWQKLDGATALKYARERHADPEGDFGRAKRQQQVLSAMQTRAFSLSTFTNPFTLYRFLESLGESITTDIDPVALRRLLELGRNVDTHNVTTVVLDAWKAESLLRVDHLATSQGPAFILVPRSGGWSEVRSLAQNLFDHAALERERRALTQEEASLTILAPTQSFESGERLRDFLRSAGEFKNVILKMLSRSESAPTSVTVCDETGLSKPFTYNFLISHLNAETCSPERTSETERSDFLVTLPADYHLSGTLQSDSETTDAPDDFDTPLPPQTFPQP